MKASPLGVFSTTTARQHLGQILDRAHFSDERFVLTYRREPVAVLLSIADYVATMKRSRRRKVKR